MMKEEVSSATLPFFLQGGGDTGQWIAQLNWARTPLGEIATWPPALKYTLNLMLHSCCPMFLYWGEDHLQMYNDAYIPTLGDSGRHPKALGKRGSEDWNPETWALIEPTLQHIMHTGKSVLKEDEYSPVFRKGRWENAHWTFCYSAVTDEQLQPLGAAKYG